MDYLKKYSQNKYLAYYLTVGVLNTSCFTLLTLFFLIKMNWINYKNLLKKLSLLSAFVFFILEYSSLIVYVSIYIKVYKIYEHYNEVKIKQCVQNEIDVSEINELFNDLLTNFIKDLKFIYSSSIIIIISQFTCITIIIYKIKLLITINLITNNDNLFIEKSNYEYTNFYLANKRQNKNSEDYFAISKYDDKIK
jgi:hypothetical protein